MDSNKKRMIIFVVATVVIAGAVVAAYYRQRSPKGVETVQEVTASPKSTAVPTPVPTPTQDPHEGMVCSSMTGEWVDKKVEKQRPYAVMINNIEYAFLHQKGTSKADILYEALAEGGITRMMAVYQDPSKVKVIGSVRSARHYYVQFANEWNAIYCHFGHTKYATAKIEELGIDNLSGLSAIGPVVYERDRSLSAPHNVFTSGKKLIAGAKKLHYYQKRKKNRTAKHFYFHGEDRALHSKKKARNITLPFSNYSTCQLKYNEKKKKYEKFEYGQKHMDNYYKKQLSFKNIIIQLVEESNIDHNGYQTMELTDHSGRGYYVTDGKAQKITWKREEKGNAMVYRDKKGDVLSMNPGKTYIAVYPGSRAQYLVMK